MEGGSSFGKMSDVVMSHCVILLSLPYLPSLFAMASSKEAWVADLWNQSNFSSCWTASFPRNLND